MTTHHTAIPHRHSPLFVIPVELRLTIYEYIIPLQSHVRLREGKLSLSACLAPGLQGVDVDYNKPLAQLPLADTLSGSERRNKSTNEGYGDQLWARRLQSAWGPHWKCEEHALNESFDGSLFGTLLVCKQMYSEVVDIMTRTAGIHITDLETVNCFGERTDMPCAPLRSFSSLLSQVNHLDLTFRLPLRIYQDLEKPEDALTTESEHVSALNRWLQVGKTLSSLKNLKSLHIWLDHDDPCAWSVVNERVVLAPLIPPSGTPDLNISLSLPKINPRYESEDRHFINKSPPSVQLHRRMRQRYHTNVCWRGRLEVEHRPDFPYFIDIIDHDEVTMAKLEAEERSFWEKGIDTEKLVEEVSGLRFAPWSF